MCEFKYQIFNINPKQLGKYTFKEYCFIDSSSVLQNIMSPCSGAKSGYALYAAHRGAAQWGAPKRW